MVNFLAGILKNEIRNNQTRIESNKNESLIQQQLEQDNQKTIVFNIANTKAEMIMVV